ncbi:MFS transporter [Virgibacillus pantothenticus]|uniref:MFS transporter n=1 Tax=Virgibacillus pantothenticus TaxID=1473 RepID=UPI001C22F59F|nr:MFS transporter [Virgibacillus pantothenticus]MBU8564907.1 MFS transporter [Virgibacillus pantothenticus]MBU8599215.1 MFS transporter [Virgibacillus pantothenticus]MBU8633382.1 MFS transporter [Virgibacillus pantothenticus]MBU8640957.1 MFS transporter [Virgibacillus pantothenticus]MBU8645114.1 MFS transporter [Virgibacillus pantothenticus]
MAELKKKRWLFIITIGLGTLLNPLNSSMIAVAVTRLQEDFALSFVHASWLISIFYLASAAGQPVMGKLSDMFGPKRLFMTGLMLVALASLLAPFSPNFLFLLACRALQAIGSSTLFPSGMSMIRTYITEGQGRALAILSIFASTSAAFGPSIGGFFIDLWDWQAIFFINFPFILMSFLLAIFILPDTKENLALKQIDLIGIGLFIASITSLILFLLSFEEGNIRWWALFAFLITSGIFYKFEAQHRAPFMDVTSLKKNTKVTMVYEQFMSINLIYYCYFFGFPIFLQQALTYSETQTGIIMLALAGFGVIIAPLAGRMIDKLGSKLPAVVGIGLLVIGTGLLLTYHETSSLGWLLVIMSVLGASNGFNNISMQTALYENIRPEDTGQASGLFQTSRYMGAILSSSLLGIMFNQQVGYENLHLVAIICLIFSVLVFAMMLRLPGKLTDSNR